jgi:steroid delta-isomerase-like uncharacterized protein
MAVTENKEKLRRLFEVGLNERKLELVDELIAPNYVNHNLPTGDGGREGFRQMAGMFASAFPDMRITLHEVFGEGDRVGARGSWTGTHQGDFMGIPPTGKQVEVGYIDIWRVEDGQFTENWVQMDLIGLMQQLGVAPGP